MTSGKGKKAYVGLSGGVDSSVSAALLKEAGYDVTGVFIKVWQPEWLEGTSECTWREDRLDAMRVCAKLRIPFVTLDLEEAYKREVVDYMVAEYRAGRTPNPDIMCNRYVKFGGFFDWAIAQGADVVATGHYAQIKKESKKGADVFKLVAGKDKNKDQSYFLWTLTQSQLVRTKFPVGGLEKPEVRALAKRFGLATAEKRDSQGLCFMGKVDVKEFLAHYIEKKKGDVIDEKGKKVGEHDGALFVTIGERLSFVPTRKSPGDKALYVVSKDADKNTVTVSAQPRSSAEGDAAKVRIHGANWVGEVPKPGKRYYARLRYRQELEPCEVDGNTIVFREPQLAAPGQSAVVYDGDECLGGGIIGLL